MQNDFAFSTLFSGPQAGEKLPALKVALSYGQDASKIVDFIEQAANRPTLLVIVNGANRPAANLTRCLMNYAEMRADKLFAGVVYLDGDRSAGEQYLRQTPSWWGVYNSVPKLRAIYDQDDVCIEMFNFEQPHGLKYVCMEVRGQGNPLPLLQSLCQRTGWSIAEAGRDGEFLNFDENSGSLWKNWQKFLHDAIDQAVQRIDTGDDSETM